MASYPTSVKSFTTKLDGAGNPINAAHINDLQDEVSAIEAGIINGTAQLNSSNSTVAKLSVTGGSTLAGTLSVVGGSTFTIRPVEPPPESALVFRDSTAVIGSSVRSTVAWIAESFVQNSSMHSTGTNPERLTPQSTGFYRFDAQFQLPAPSGASTVFIQIIDSSNTGLGSQSQIVGGQATLNVSGYKRFDALGGYCTVEFVNNGGGSTFSISSGIGASWFAMAKM